MLRGSYLSISNWDGYSSTYALVGFRNYVELMKDSAFRVIFLNTFFYGVASTAIQQIVGLGLALVVNNKFRGSNTLRAIIYLPALVSPIVMGTMYYIFFRYNNGALNDIMVVVGLNQVAWLSSPSFARLVLVLVNSFQFVGISMIIYLAGLQGISKTYYEAASIDGASPVEQFKNITVPLLAPAFTTSIVLNLIGGLKLYDIIMALTGGGPGFATHSISTYIGFTYFRDQAAGSAAAQGVVLFLVIAVMTVALNKWLSSNVVEQE